MDTYSDMTLLLDNSFQPSERMKERMNGTWEGLGHPARCFLIRVKPILTLLIRVIPLCL